ncbi:PREDICTED: uncharacterized protein LOC108578234 [Habropoda laboriosa]|uniref:uncharacterized protein LOC108578234 n=1 Tax=Habropoda laboriosa TaxID=597456 RepID=UPI00083D677A|nr:PREDICTED: uncharacterized protein LOC108578234 [Habropoda laboriosa]
MTSELRNLIKERATVKAQLSRLNNYLRQLETVDIPALERRKQKLEEYYVSFSNVQSRIEAIDDNPQQDQNREDFEILYYECGDFIDRELDKLNRIPPHSNTVVTPSISAPQSILPKIHIKPFDGNYAEWQDFHDTFKSLIHDNETVPIIHKFHLLKSYLTGNAATVTNSLTASEENYFVAWELVQRRFNKPRKIIQSHIRALFKLPEMTGKGMSSLRALTEAAEMHVNALRSLRQPVDWDEILIYVVTAKLDKATRTSWERTFENSIMPKFKDLLAFLNKYARDDEPIQLISTSREPIRKQRDNQSIRTEYRSQVQGYKAHAFVNTNTAIICALCKADHYLTQCPKLLSQLPTERLRLIKTLKLCVNCFRGNHSYAQCRAGVCRKCIAKHHTLLHIEKPNSLNNQVNSSQNRNSLMSSASPLISPKPGTLMSLTTVGRSEVLLATARVKILDSHNREHECRVLLDAGSQSNFITEELANKLQLHKGKINIPVVGLGYQTTNLKHSVITQFKSRFTNSKHEAKFLVIPIITSYLPSRIVDSEHLKIPSNVELADPYFNIPATIDALLGEYLFYKLIRSGQIRLKNETAILQETQLGWVFSGEVGDKGANNSSIKGFLTTTNLDTQLAKFWELEEQPSAKSISPEDEQCENLFRESTQRNPNGRYIVRLPFNEKKDKLGDSYKVALKRFYCLERKLEQNSELREQYNAFIEEYERLNHMTNISDTVNSQQGYYLPHHAVIKASSLTTKIRVVFDGSAKTSSGLCVNDTLLTGPTLQDDLFSLILRFRTHAYVLTADIEKMFRQVVLHPKDTVYYKILWRKNPKDAIKTYHLNTITYGTSCAPFLAVRCLQQLASDERTSYPLAANTIENDFYMDDLLTGTRTLDDAIKLREQLIGILKAGGFNLRQWASNEPSLIEGFMGQTTDEYLYLDSNNIKKTLGICWKPRKDYFTYRVNIINREAQETKRTMLSKIAQIFDPLGLLGPVVVRAKIFFQQFWKTSLDWDEAIPTDLFALWKDFVEDLSALPLHSRPWIIAL